MFDLQQGIKNPRDGSINWMSYEAYETRAAAVKAARSFKGRWRIVESKIVWTNEKEEA